MHEFSIAQAIIETASAEARRVGAVRVNKVTCRIGTMRQVDDWLMKEAFDIAKQGTPCASSELLVEKAYMQARCPSCQQRFAVRDWDWACPTCGALGQDMTGGDELDLLSIEAEMPDED